MATFGEIQTRVSTRLKDPNNVDISASDVAAIVNDAIEYWSEEHFWFNEFEETVTLVQDDPNLPALTVTPIRIFKEDGIVINYASTRWPVSKVSSQEYDDMNVQGRGIPFAFTYRDGGYELYWYPDAAYSAVVRGIKAYTALSDSTDTNDFTDNAAVLIMYEALSRAYAEFRQDEKMETYYSARAENEAKKLKRRTRKNIASGRVAVEGL